MTTGYQLVEPASLGTLLGRRGSFSATIALLHWICHVTRIELAERMQNASLEVVRVEYGGAYPAIAIQYSCSTEEDLGPVVEATVERVIRERPALEFIDFLITSPLNWKEEAERLLK